MVGLSSPVRRPGRPRLIRPIGDTTAPVPSAPAAPSTPSPADASTALYTLLSWVSAGATKFDVYLDTVSPPVALVGVHVVGASFVPTLQPLTTYYWQVVAINGGGSATGPIWSFTTPRATTVLVSLAGVPVTNARFGSLSIHDVLGAAPNTATLLCDQAPEPGQAITIGLGALDNRALLFSGEIQSLDQSYVDTTSAQVWPVNLIDQTFRINKRRPFGTWVNVSATTIAQYCVAVFAPGFTSNGVQANLPLVSINLDGSDDFMTCMRKLATAIGGQTKVDYSRDVRLFLVDTSDAPDPVDTSHPPLNVPTPLKFSTDLSQIRTRGYGKGANSTVPCDLGIGETIVPLALSVMFTATGGRAIAGSTSGGAQTQVLTYAGVQLGGGGSLVGPGVAPTVAPSLALAFGSGLTLGTFSYAYTDVTASGESLPSPSAMITTRAYVAPPAPGFAVSTTDAGAQAGYAVGDTVEFAISYSAAALESDLTSETALSPSTGVQTLMTAHPPLPAGQIWNSVLTLAYSSDPLVTWIHIWRRHNGGAYFRYQQPPVPNVVGTGTLTMTTNLSITTDTVPAAQTTFGQVAITGVAIGASPTSSRKVYRTAVNGAQLKLLLTQADNTTTGPFTDTTADASLGANVPTGDASGLQQVAGQVNAGSVSLLTAGAGPFPVRGGWAILPSGNLVRYTGQSGNTLTGIPSSGLGSITTTVPYGSPVVPAPALTGINANNGLARAIANGSTVAIWVQRDDLAAQAALGQLELDDAGNPTDGIREYTISDGRYDEVGLTALVDADLAQFSAPIVSVTYQNRDTKGVAGKTVHVDLPSLGIFGDFVIQNVTITVDGPALYPRCSVQASSVTFTLADLLRRVLLT